MDYKQAILIRTDLKMGKGKIAAQASHASIGAAFKVMNKKPEAFREWFSTMTKIVLKVKDEKELFDYVKKADREHVVYDVVHDAGRTQVEPGTVTALAIGPDSEEKIDSIVNKLKLL
jgi:PTH2 family peptidyl-tRNA hydrolase